MNIIEEFEKTYPETAKEFKKIQQQQYEIFCAKQLNYGPTNISVGTKLETDDEVRLSLMGLWFRKNDKIQRLKQLVVLNKKDLVGEDIQDTYMDLSVYGIISMLVSKKIWGK